MTTTSATQHEDDITKHNPPHIYQPPHHASSHVASRAQYDAMYKESVEQPEAFWGNLAKKDFYWQTPFTQVLDANFDMQKGPVKVEWFRDGKTNLCYNCLDRHLPQRANQVAYYWEANDPSHDQDASITYGQLYEQVCLFANLLKHHGVKKGDRVAIYLPMIIELVVAVLACARIGAVHNVVFAGFSAESMSQRLLDSEARLIVTADAVMRGNKRIPLKHEVDEACNKCEAQGFTVTRILVVDRLTHAPYVPMNANMVGGKQEGVTGPTKADYTWKEGRDVWLADAIRDYNEKNGSRESPVEWMNAEDPLFMLYTSGSTGKPKGLLHTTGGYMVYAATTFKYVFDYHEGDIYWCTADIGWITGHSYVVYGPMCNGATQILFEGIPIYPDAGRLWHMCDKYQVTIFYTAPTLIRSLMRLGDEPIKKHKRTSLRILGSVGEPINPEAWLWYYNVIGNGNCAVIDTYWQTETGGHIITALPGAISTKPGSATVPFFGIIPVVLDEKGNKITFNESDPVHDQQGYVEGFLCIAAPWPGQARTVYGDHARFEATYYSMFKGYYVTGDGCKLDRHGYYWLTGRIDDVLNVSGHRLGTAEIESAFVSHPSVAEAAVVPIDDKIKGQGIYCYVTLKEGHTPSDQLKATLKQHVRTVIGAIATPDVIHWAQTGLPKTRSGKIMRRILRKIAEGTEDSLGDISTLADKNVVADLIASRPAF